MLLYLFNTKGI